jgi:proliferating cell nuclear antigen
VDKTNFFLSLETLSQPIHFTGAVFYVPMTTADLNNDYLVYFESSQVVQFKTLFDVLKDLLTETCLRFDEQGFKIISLDPAKIGMIHCSVSNLEKYFCAKSPFYCGIYVSYLYKILRSVNTSHHLECRIRKNNPKVMELVVSNAYKRTQTIHRLKLLDLDVEEINIPIVDFECVISMPSAEFQRYIKELSHVSNLITIRGSGKLIQFICNGDLGETCIEVSPTPSGLNWLHKDSVKETFEGTYFLKYLERFSRGQVDSTVEIYFKQDYPLIMRYEMTIGSLRFCVAPINKEKA